MVAGGSTAGTAFGRCGGRPLHNRLEQTICDRLTGRGIAHSHRPRHFEISVSETEIAAFAPTIVLRGRGREGKTVVVECAEKADTGHVAKIRWFREQYGSEFYICFVATEETLEEIPLGTFDEGTATTDLHTLVSRLAD